MKPPDFLAFAGESRQLKPFLSALVPRTGSGLRLDRRLDSPGLVIFAPPECPIVPLADTSGLVVGRLFEGGDAREPIRALNQAASRRAISSGGKSLLAEAWGNYAAFLVRDGDIIVLRDPSGAVPVHHVRLQGVEVYFSHPDIARDVGVEAAAVDETFLRQWLSFPYLRTARTGLEGVSELLPGTARRTRGGEARMETAWNPWTSAAAEQPEMNFREAAERLRATLLHTIGLQLAGGDQLLLELSGGLDSSIVAASLASNGIPFRGANFVTRLPDGDETGYAREVAALLGIALAELHEDKLPLDLSLPAHGLLRPLLSPVLQPLDRAFGAHAKVVGASAVVTGAGGDNIFCYINTAAPILDALHDLGFGSAVRIVLPDVARLGGCTIWRAARLALRKRARLHRRPKWKSDFRFLTPAAIAEIPDPHPWLDAPPGATPGKLEHVDSLVRAQHFLADRYPTGQPLLHPLINQPLMELCLAIPSWLWVQGGANRAVARHAFAGLLPPAIINRRTKGRLESMCARAFTDNRLRLAELLLDGELSRRGLVDRAQLAAYLGQAGPPRDEAYFRIFDLVSLELWLRSRAEAFPLPARSASVSQRRY
jgi:asparagine synthase (glutamine-hydrolysing)